ncbi:MAG: alkaline phosphatase family protein [Thermoanaerobaculia bacterium]
MSKVFAASLCSLQDPQGLRQAGDDLARSCWNDRIGIIPSTVRSLVGVQEFLLRLGEVYDEIVVFAFDGVSYEFACEVLAQPLRASDAWALPLTSCFPTTTATAWASMILGVPPSAHGIYGTSFLHEEIGATYLWIGDVVLDTKGGREPAPSSLRIAAPSQLPTLFELFSERGFDCLYFGFHGTAPSGRLLRELSRGAHLLVDGPCYRRLKEDPEVLVRAALTSTSRELSKGGRRTVIWNYLDVDDFIHAHGFERLRASVRWTELGDFVASHRTDRRAFVFVADHGQVPQEYRDLDVLRHANSQDLFRASAGGAGRTLYFYPRPGAMTEARDWVESFVDGSGIVLDRHELAALKVISVDAVSPNRIGDLVAIATDAAFPSAGCRYRFEHGALMPQEAIVPLVVCAGNA